MPESRRRRRPRGGPARSQRSRAQEQAPPGFGTRTVQKLGIRPRVWRRMRRWVYLASAGLIAALVILSFGLTSFPTGGRAGSSAGGPTQPNDSIGTIYADGGAVHVNEPTSVVYTTMPPHSGNHWPQWAECGVYDFEVPDERIVHNLEHGQIVISYNLTDQGDIDSLVALTKELEEFDFWGILRPYSKLDEGKVGMSAWTVIDVMDGVDEERITRFYDEYYRNRFSNETQSIGRGIPCGSTMSS